MTQTLPQSATSVDVRPITEPELRQSTTLFLGAVHVPPVPDEKWDVTSRSYHVARTFGAFDDTGMIGTASSFPSTLTVPGGAVLPAAAVTDVGVRTDRRRRGVLTAVMRTQLAAVAEAGEVFAMLHASEPVIYGRFGYGLGTVARTLTVTTRRAALRPEVPGAGEGDVRMPSKDEILELLPAAYNRLATRAGMIARATAWWTFGYERRLLHGFLRVAAHLDGTGAVDGFVAYESAEIEGERSGARLRVIDFQAASQPVENDLWRFLIGVDLVDELVVYVRPMDDPLEAMLVNAHAVRSERDDELWLRLVDVPAALAARTYGDGPSVVLEVRDRLLPGNAGRYRIGLQGTERTTAEPGLSLDVDVLGMLYLGGWRASRLAGIGRLEVHDPAALAAADRLFATADVPWCGTLF